MYMYVLECNLRDITNEYLTYTGWGFWKNHGDSVGSRILLSNSRTGS